MSLGMQNIGDVTSVKIEKSIDEDAVAIATKAVASDHVDICNLPDEQSRQAAELLQERQAKSNPIRAYAQTMMCQEGSVPAGKEPDKSSPYSRLAKQYMPFLTWMPLMRPSTFKADLIAGTTVAVMVIPQSMSYANIAGLPYIYGMYSAFVPTFIYAFFGQSRQLAVGPVAMVSLLVEAGLSPYKSADCADKKMTQDLSDPCNVEIVKLAVLVTFLVGVLQTLACLVKAGFIVCFLGHPVTSGFTSGAAIIIGLSQVKYILGYSVPKSQYLHYTLYYIFRDIRLINWATVILGLVSIAFLYTNKKLAGKYKRLKFMAPLGPLICCGIGLICVALIKPLRTDLKVKYVGDIPSGLPPLSIQDWNFADIGKVFPTAISACLIGYMESIAIGKNLAAKHGYEIEAGQELLALGVANFVGAIFSCYPVTGSFSRSAVNNATGALTQFSGLWTSVMMFIVLLFLTPYFYYLPKFCLASVVINSVIPLVAFGEARRLMRVKRHDFFLWVVAFVGTLFLGVLLGIAVAVSVSLCIVIYESVRPQLTILWRIPGTTIYRNVKQESSGSFVPNVFICRIGSSMYFANAAFIKDMLLSLVMTVEHVNNTEYLVLEMTPVVSIDSTAVHVIEDIVHDFRARGIQVAFAMVGNRVEKTMRKAKLKEAIGAHWFFPTVNDAVHYCLRHQHVKRKRLNEDADKDSSMFRKEISDLGQAAVHPGSEFGHSNDLHHACTMIFICTTAETNVAMAEAAAIFRKNEVRIERCQVEPLNETNTKHTYFCKSVKTDGKLDQFEIDRIRRDLTEILHRGSGDEAANSNKGSPNGKARAISGDEKDLMESVRSNKRLEAMEQALTAEKETNETIQKQLAEQAEQMRQILNLQQQLALNTAPRGMRCEL